MTERARGAVQEARIEDGEALTGLAASASDAKPAALFSMDDLKAGVRQVEYDERVRILAVELANGACYHFLDVPEPVYTALVKAPAPLDYLRLSLAGRFAFRQIL